MKVIHKVSYSDTIEKICEEYGCDFNELVKINDIKNNNLQGLSELLIPKNDTDFIVIKNLNKEIFFVVKKDNIDKAKKMLKESDIVAVSKHDELEIGDKIIFRSGNVKVHIVKPLENVSQIARVYGVSSDYLLSRNKLKTGKLFIGQKLLI